ncbi:hypothetical protein OAU50_05440 [Planctomycetota bacterium]|nr:hypothetical protein [Planctomycetota bacterium]
MRIGMLLIVLLIAPFAVAQDKVDLAVGFPATTLAYSSTSEDWVEYAEEFGEAFEGFGQDFDVPSLGKIFRESLALTLTDEEADALVGGVLRGSFGLLDITVSGPKMQLALEHKDLSALIRALDKGHKDNPDLIEGIEDYYGTNIYSLYVPLGGSDSAGDFNPTDQIMNYLIDTQFYLAVLENKYLVLSTAKSSVKDAVDFLSFPEDAEDTLLSNKRYLEAIAEFKDPDALLFVNISSVITTMERVSGDQGSNPMLEMILGQFLRGEDTAEFLFSLVQYEQFKSFAAALDYHPEQNTFVANASLQFHNAPGWFEALRVEPSDWVFTDYIPSNALLAVSNTSGDYDKIYNRFRDYFFGRAKNAGQEELMKAWKEGETELVGGKDQLVEMLKRFGNGVAFVSIPSSKVERYGSGSSDGAAIFALKDFNEAETYFYNDLLHTKIGKNFQDQGMENEASPIKVYRGVEIHHNTRNDGFAFVPDGEQGVLLFGDVPAICAVIDAKQDQKNLKKMVAFSDAKALTWDKVSTNFYMNIGSTFTTSDRIIRSIKMGGMIGGARKVRDDTDIDDSPNAFLSDVFSKTAFVAAATSTETGVNLRFAMAGLPTKQRTKDMLKHFKMVSLNTDVRNDLLQIRRGLADDYCITGKLNNIGGLVESGRIEKSSATDNYDPENKRGYEVTGQVDEPDIRQAILLAHQTEPGLRGKYLAVLWNGDIVALTEEQLTDAKDRAAKGERLDDQDWYKEALAPLYETYEDWEEAEAKAGWGVARKAKTEVVIIDEDGNEEIKEVNEDNAAEETEKILDDLDEIEKAEEKAEEEE